MLDFLLNESRLVVVLRFGEHIEHFDYSSSWTLIGFRSSEQLPIARVALAESDRWKWQAFIRGTN